MAQLRLTWVTAGALAAALVGVGVLVSARLRRREAGSAIREVGVVIGLFALWILVGRIVGHVGGGYARGMAIWHLEQTLHIADEASLQRPLLGHRWLVQAANYYYAYAHWVSVDVALAWLWLRHRARYVATRTALVAFTGGCLLLHIASTAPPRLLGQTHLVDTAARLGESVYGDTPGLSDHLSAMPSIHVGWAVLLLAAVWPTRSAAARGIACLHAVLTAYVVVVTGNHFWLDGAVAAALVAVVLLVMSAAAARRSVAADMADFTAYSEASQRRPAAKGSA